MNTRTMKALDHYVGIPVCIFLEIVHKVSLLLPQRQPSTPPGKILIMKYFGMGSILLSSPTLKAIKKRYPDAKLGFLTFSANRNMVERLELVDYIYTLRTDSFIHFAADLFRQIALIRRAGFDATIDMEFFSKFSTIMTFLTGSPIRIGYFLRQLWRGDLLTHQIYYNQYKHITEVLGALAAPLDVKVAADDLQRPAISPEEQEEAADLLQIAGVSAGGGVIGFNVNVSDLSLERRWPKESFQDLARGLLQELDVRLVFIGAPAEVEYVNEVLAPFASEERVINLAGKTSLGVLLGVLTRCTLFISNDSGPLHLAASTGSPTVSLFGPETPSLYGPKGGDTLVFHEPLYCSPCLNVFNVKTAPCAGNNICLRSIQPDAVLEGVHSHFSHLWQKFGKSAGSEREN